jgi:ligand-binding sensor domain-containing protein/signal transduction histidine kinase
MTITHVRQLLKSALPTRLPIRACFLALALDLICGPALALDPSREPSQYALDNWQMPEGLPQTSARAIARTPDGYLWIGTQGGLARFDGVRFTVFDSNSEPALPNNFITALFVDRDGRMWIGTSSGIVVLENGHFTAFSKVASLEHAFIRSIIEDKGGRLWVGTEGGLFEIDDGRARSFSITDGLPDDRIRALHEDRKGVLWVGTASGLARFDGSRFETVPLAGESAGTPVTAMHEDNDGSWWVGTESGGLYRSTGNRFDALVQGGPAGPERLSSVRALLRDHDGNLWICTSSGLVRWSEGKFSTLASGLFADSDLRAILEDNEGSLWVGSFSVGLLRLRDGKFITAGVPEGLQGNLTWTIAPRKSGGLWVGSNLGLSSYVGGRFQHIPGPHGHENMAVRAVVEDRQGVLWVGTAGAGVYRLNQRGMKLFDRQAGLSGDTVTALLEDRLSRIWVGTEAGLDVIERGKITSMQSLLHTSAPAPIHLIYQDRAENLWIATWTHGLFVIGEHGTRHLGSADGLPSDFVIAIHEDEKGDMWLGTSNGLALWRGGKLVSLARSPEPLRENILQLLEDDAHQFWFSTNKGLITAPRSALEALASGEVRGGDFHVYGTKDGLRSAEFDGGNTDAGTRTPDGLLWFPSSRGIVGVDPSHIRMNALPPPVIIEQIAVDGAPLTLNDGVKVAPGAEQWEFHYTGMSLLVPQRSLFKYRLDGFDKDWISAGSRRTAYYTHLPPGSYTFRVIASNDDGVWNNTGARFGFILKPRFYQTSWFALLCIFATLAAAGACYRWRVARLKHLADTLREQVAERTRELVLANKQMREAQDTLVTTARQAGMAEIANNVLHNVGNVLNSVNVSAALIGSKLRDSKSAGLGKAVNLMNEHAADLGTFITLDERGKALPGYLNKLVAALAQEKQGVADELDSLTKSVDHIKEIVATQQSYSGVSSVIEPVQIKDLLEDALRINIGSIAHHQISIVKEFAEVPLVLLDKHLMLQILINLIGNAKHAITPGTQKPSQITLKVDIAESTDKPRLRIRVQDNGEGIAQENLSRLFAHGFTTRKNGHGFGLHSCALAAKEMRGSITAFSDGLGRGAAFVLELPMNRVPESA